MPLKRPREPTAGECCGSGCARCVWDMYYDQLAAYEEERSRLKEAGQLSESDDDESEESDLSSDSSEGVRDYIGTVVVKMLDSSAVAKDAARVVTEALEAAHFYPIRDVKLRHCSASDASADTEESICILDLSTPKLTAVPCAGDVVEILAPNDAIAREDLVRSVCERLQVSPDSVCELHRSPFVPEDHFPPWLPLRQAMTVRTLLTHYVDLSSCSYLLRPVFFQSLLRIFNNKNRGQAAHDGAAEAAAEAHTGSITLLRACAEESTAPQVFRTILNKGKPLCYPCLTDVLDVFPFVHLPLDRLLEISGPLQPRKFSVADYTEGTAGEMDRVQLCIRKLTKSRTANQLPSLDKTARELVDLLNRAAERRHTAGETPSVWFHGHTSVPLVQRGMTSRRDSLCTEAGVLTPSRLYLGTAQFGTSVFAQELRNALVSLSHAPKRCGPLILVGAGTGIAPLVAAVMTLVRSRQSSPVPLPPFPCWTFYGARTTQELVYHDALADAHRVGAISRYTPALSREVESPTPHKHVTDVLREHAAEIRAGLESGSAQIFVCGPTAVLRSVRQYIGGTVLGEADDDDSVREQRMILLEKNKQVLFDVWSTINIFE